MEDPYSFYGIYKCPSLDDLFGAANQQQQQQRQPLAATLIPTAATTNSTVPLPTSPPPLRDDDDQHGVPDFNFSEDFQALWDSLSEADPSEIRDHNHPPPTQSQINTNNDNDNEQVAVGGGSASGSGHQNVMRPHEIWPPKSSDCNFCQVLRQTIHVHYEHNNCMKLEIHGTLGAISHATVETKINNANNTSSGLDTHFQLIDFSSKSSEEVKLFLTNYFSQRKEEGYVMSNDPMLIFFDTLSLGLPSDQILHNIDFVSTLPHNNISPAGGSDHQIIKLTEQQEHEQERGPKRAASRRRRSVNPRISLAEQRKRTGIMTLCDLRGVFHLELSEAAKRMQVCATVLKAVCRRGGVTRWPYRKVDSVKKKIAALQRALNSSDPDVSAEAQTKINALRVEAALACGGISIL